MKKTFVRLIALAVITAFACMTLASCGALLGPATDPDKAEKALEKKDYEVEVADSNTELAMFEFMGVKDLECVLTAYNEDDDEDAIVIFYFKDKGAAEEGFEALEDYAEEAGEEVDDFVFKKSGKIVYMGTKKAVAASR